MGKLLLFLSCVCLAILIIGTSTMPQTSAFWMASSLPIYQVIRVALSAVLLTQFATDPPRNRAFRILGGLIASSVAIWALDTTYNNQMEFLDSFSLLAAACAIGITALEIDPQETTLKQSQTSS